MASILSRNACNYCFHSLSLTTFIKNQTTNNSKPIANPQHGKITNSDSGFIANPLLCQVLKKVGQPYHPRMYGKQKASRPLSP